MGIIDPAGESINFGPIINLWLISNKSLCYRRDLQFLAVVVPPPASVVLDLAAFARGIKGWVARPLFQQFRLAAQIDS